MLIHTPSHRGHRVAAASQQGIVLLMALIVLVALTLAALALTRSVYTSNAIAGNVAFQQAATHSADAGIEAAIAWLENNNNKTSSSSAASCTDSGSSTVLACDQGTQGYIAHRQDPTPSQSWSDFWNKNIAGSAKTLPADNAGNTVAYVIQRMCSIAGDAQATGNDCTVSPTASSSTCSGGSSCDAQRVNLASISQVYYRITVKVTGPRNTQSYVQSMVAM
jgi:Tfp pilus assembly protein PilX